MPCHCSALSEAVARLKLVLSQLLLFVAIQMRLIAVGLELAAVQHDER